MDGTVVAHHLHAQALVPATDPSALGAALVRAFGGGWQASAGSIRTGAAMVDVQAWPDGVRLDAYAHSEAELREGERAVSEALARLDVSSVAWHTRPSTIPGAPPLEAPEYNFPFDDDHDD